MPTYDYSSTFIQDIRGLTNQDYARFMAALRLFIQDLQAMEAGHRTTFRRGLRVKGVKGAPGVFEMTWAPDGRATFTWGDPIRKQSRHIQWRRCGGHEIFARP